MRRPAAGPGVAAALRLVAAPPAPKPAGKTPAAGTAPAWSPGRPGQTDRLALAVARAERDEARAHALELECEIKRLQAAVDRAAAEGERRARAHAAATHNGRLPSILGR